MVTVPLLKRLAGIPLVVLALYQCGFALKVMMSDASYFSVQRQVVFWGEDDYVPTMEQVTAAQRDMALTLARWPRNADYLALQGRLYLWQALLSTRRNEADAALRQAIASVEQSLVARPANPYTWAQYAEYLAARRLDREALEFAVARVAALAPGDAPLAERSAALLVR